MKKGANPSVVDNKGNGAVMKAAVENNMFLKACLLYYKDQNLMQYVRQTGCFYFYVLHLFLYQVKGSQPVTKYVFLSI